MVGLLMVLMALIGFSEMNWKGSNFFVADIWKWRFGTTSYLGNSDSVSNSPNSQHGTQRLPKKAVTGMVLVPLPCISQRPMMKRKFAKWFWKIRGRFCFFFREFGDTKSCWEVESLIEFSISFLGSRVGFPAKDGTWCKPSFFWDLPRQASPGKWIQPFPPLQVYIRRQRGEWQRPDATGPLQSFAKHCDVHINAFWLHQSVLSPGLCSWIWAWAPGSPEIPMVFWALLERMMLIAWEIWLADLCVFFFWGSNQCLLWQCNDWGEEWNHPGTASTFKFHKVNERIVKARKAIWRYSAESCSFSQPLWSCKNRASSMINDSIWSKKTLDITLSPIFTHSRVQHTTSMNSAIPAFVHSYKLWLLWSFRSDDGWPWICAMHSVHIAPITRY